jgi:anti-sigma regulatory factor (Ser/Thr protein kinase)
VAETLQRSLLPQSLPELPGASLAAIYLAGSDEASVGGDWYDAFTLGESRVALVIGDVVGRGVKAAAVMGQLRNSVRAYLLEEGGPADTLGRVNRLLETIGGGFATLFCALLDLESGELRYASAGHPPPMIVQADGTTRWLDGALSPPIGATDDTQYLEATDELPVGAALAMYTDGLVERRTEPIDVGFARVAASATDCAGDATALAQRLVRSMPGAERPDDVALLAVARHAAPGDTLTLRLPAEPQSLGPLRERLRAWLREGGAPPRLVNDVLLASGEAASNAVEHPVDPSPPAIVVTARLDGGHAEIVVRDHGRWRDGSSGRFRGRGLQIMRALSPEVEIARGPSGSTVRIRLPIADRVGEPERPGLS